MRYSYFKINAPLSPIAILLEDEKVIKISLDGELDTDSRFPIKAAEAVEIDPVASISDQLNQYFAGKLKRFNFPHKIYGTTFSKKVLGAMRKIGYGQTKSYGRIAQDVGSEKGARAVGMACRNNPLPLLYPCHRVVGADGALVGFAGGLDKKKFLLDLETGHRNGGYINQKR